MRIGLIGTGNLAWNLAMALRGSSYQLHQVFSRDLAHAQGFASEFGIGFFGNQPHLLDKDLDLVLICSNDNMIAEVAAAYAPFAGIKTVFAHTSGAAPLSLLDPLGPNAGVFYPLQTFTRGHLADFRQVPMFLEGNAEVLSALSPLAKHLSDQVRELNSAGRLQLHLGAVFASNFANFMWILAEESLQGLEGLDLKVYGPLVRECVAKAFEYGPQAAQTGPARRGDKATMEKHLQILSGQDSARQHLYQLLSEMIEKQFGS